MADKSIYVSGKGNAPQGIQISDSQEIILRSIRAVFDATAAANASTPNLVILDQNGNEVGRYPANSSVAAGGSVEVTWFPGGEISQTSTTPTTPGTWRRVAEPLISPTVGWESNQVQEPDVHFEAGTYKMWYTAGNTNLGMGLATCSGDPTVPGNWSKNAGNPLLGQGGSGVAGVVAGISVIKVSGTYHCFYYDAIGGGNLKRSTSADGISWNAPTTAIASNAQAGVTGWANTAQWFDGSNWFMFVEARTAVGPLNQWSPYLFKNSSISGDGSWAVQNGGNPLTSLQVSGYNVGYGQGPVIAEIDGTLTFSIGGTFVLWTHASATGSPSTSDIYHSLSNDTGFVSWVPQSPFDLIHNGSTFEPSQVADPCVLQVTGQSYLFFSGQNANTAAGYINLATYNGTLAQFLAGQSPIVPGTTLIYGTATTNTTATGTTWGTGTDVLNAALTFQADGVSDYEVTVSSPVIQNSSGGGSATRVSLNLDGADGGKFAEYTENTANSAVPFTASGFISKPSAGAHTVNVRLWVSGGTGTLQGGAGGAGATEPCLVTLSVL